MCLYDSLHKDLANDAMRTNFIVVVHLSGPVVPIQALIGKEDHNGSKGK